MAAPKQEIIEWLNGLPDNAMVGIDDGGLCLVEVGGGVTEDGEVFESYLEIGGLPDGECEACADAAEDEREHFHATYCGSFCEEHGREHIEECEVCKRDFA